MFNRKGGTTYFNKDSMRMLSMDPHPHPKQRAYVKSRIINKHIDAKRPSVLLTVIQRHSKNKSLSASLIHKIKCQV